MSKLIETNYEGVNVEDLDQTSSSYKTSNTNFKKKIMDNKFNKLVWILAIGLCILFTTFFFTFGLQKTNNESAESLSSEFDMNELKLVSGCQNNEILMLYNNPATNQFYTVVPFHVVNQGLPLLFVEQLVSGVGIQKIFLDSGSVISQVVVSFHKSGPNKLLLKSETVKYVGDSQSIAKSFASSTPFSFEILRTTSMGYLINIDEIGRAPIGFVTGNDFASAIVNAYGTQYTYALDLTKSSIDTGKSNSYRAYVQSNLSYSFVPNSNAKSPPNQVLNVLPAGTNINLIVRRTLIVTSYSNVPFESRLYHPMSSFNSISVMDEDNSLLEQRQKLHIVRHHLSLQEETSKTKANTNLQQSSDKFEANSVRCKNNFNSLQYYVDSSTPPDILAALQEGVGWWDEAFQYAGYPAGTFKVSVAPKNYDVFDFHQPRTHFVEWIHRDLRDFSVGIRVQNPSTGEIIKGHVRIESLRMREDALLAEALLGPFDHSNGAETVSSLNEKTRKALNQYIGKTLSDDVLNAVYQRVKQLGAHEVGHTLGLSHNFAGSTYKLGYASVMDYPPPIVKLDETGQNLILNENSYSNGIGFFDKVAINYGYRDFSNATSTSEEDEQTALYSVINDAVNNGYVFLTDEDSDISESDWRDTKWDSGTNPNNALNYSLLVRHVALSKLDTRALSWDSPLSHMQDIFPIVYYWHRYEVEAASKLLGGIAYQYTMVGDTKNRQIKRPCASMQRRALSLLIDSISPMKLKIPKNLMSLMLPNAFGYVSGITDCSFVLYHGRVDEVSSYTDLGGMLDRTPSRTGNSFDPVAAMEIAVNMVLSAVFHPKRLERIAYQPYVDPNLPGLSEVLNAFLRKYFSRDVVDQILPIDANSTASFTHSGMELMVCQSTLINAFLTIRQSPTAGTSAHVISIVDTFLRTDVTMTLNWMIELSSPRIRNNCINGADEKICDQRNNFYTEWMAHVKYLQQMVTTLKPFTTILTIPNGAPI